MTFLQPQSPQNAQTALQEPSRRQGLETYHDKKVRGRRAHLPGREKPESDIVNVMKGCG